MSDSAFWNSFHDGIITHATGPVPGDVVLDIAINYLRQRFPGGGQSFRVSLLGCTQFEYEDYDGNTTCVPGEVPALEPMLLSLETNEPLVINCVMGVLRLTYERFIIATDGGLQVSADELRTASCEYWKAWSANQGVNT